MTKFSSPIKAKSPLNHMRSKGMGKKSHKTKHSDNPEWEHGERNLVKNVKNVVDKVNELKDTKMGKIVQTVLSTAKAVKSGNVEKIVKQGVKIAKGLKSATDVADDFTDPADDDSSDTADNDAGTLFVKPTPTSSQTANVYHVEYPSIDHADTVIANFPDEAEYLVVLRASMTAVEYKMSTEEDVDLYGPILKNLNTLYQEGVYSLKTGNFAAPSKDVRIATKGEKE